MNDDDTVDPDPGPAVIRGYLYRSLDLLAREMLERAAANRGKLSADDVAAALEAVKRPDSPTLAAVCRAAWEECCVLYDSEGRGDDRKAAFERLMVWPFADMLPEGGQRDGGAGTISRRVIPGYLAAIEDMIGPLLYGRHQERCRELVRTTRGARGGAFRWNDVYDDPASQRIVDDVAIRIAEEMHDFEAQRDWIIGLVNDAMPLPTNGSGHSVALDDEGFDRIMAALFRNLMREMRSSKGRARLAERYGGAAVGHLEALQRELGGD